MVHFTQNNSNYYELVDEVFMPQFHTRWSNVNDLIVDYISSIAEELCLWLILWLS